MCVVWGCVCVCLFGWVGFGFGGFSFLFGKVFVLGFFGREDLRMKLVF